MSHDPDSAGGTRIGGARPPANEPVEMGGVIIHPGSRIGNYVFLREIGSGGMARVLLARDPGGDLVALKVLRKSRFKTGIARFRREFRALSRVNHPNVIRVDAYGDLFGHPYIAMEYVDGPDLHALIRQFRSWDPADRWRRVEEILIDLCRALSAVHRRGLVHRDLKPSNVLVAQDGTSKLTDFGIVKDLDPSQEPMMSTTLVGTWAYASPEQITGAPLDHRSDLYSLGVILFAMLTGKRPFVANDMAGYLALHRDRAAPAPREVDRLVPEHLDEICRRLLQKAPRDRYQSAQEILYRLEAEDRDQPPQGGAAWLPPLVGRQLEVEAITDAISGLTARRGGVVVLEGDDGSGKSRLLEVAQDRALTLGIPAWKLEFQKEEEAFGSVTHLGRQLTRELGARTPGELTQALAAFEASDAGQNPYTVYDGIIAAWHTLLDEQPQILLLDDLHQAPARFLEFLAYLVRSMLVHEPAALLVLATSRPKGSPAADAFAEGDDLGVEPRRIAVGPLARADILRILTTMLPDAPPARLLAQRLHKETEGNSFFVVEFLRSLLARGNLRLGEPGEGSIDLEEEEITSGHLEIPLGIRQTMRNRLEAITARDREALEVLAVGGREVDLDVLLDVLELDEEVVLDVVDRLLAAGIVRERRAADMVFYTVSHRKFADVVYRDLNPDRRARLHRRMAAALELHYAQNPAALEIVGEHYRRAGDAGRAYRYLVAAARRLQSRSLVQEAWSLTEKAAAIEESASADLPPEDFRAFRRDLLEVRAQVLTNRAEWVDAESWYRAVLRLAEEDGDASGAARARIDLSHLLILVRRFDEARDLAERALEASRALHHREGVAEALLCMAGLAWAEGHVDQVERLANEGLLVAQGSQLAEQRAELLLALTAAQANRGHLASATAGLTEAEGIFRELRKKRHRCLALANLAELLTWQGEPVQARQRAHVAWQIASDLDYKLGKVASWRASGIAALDLGQRDEAAQALGDALALARDIEMHDETLACTAALARVALEDDDLDRAAELARKALQLTASRDPERYEPVLRAHLAEAMAASRPDEARAHLALAEGAAPELPVPRRTQLQLALAWGYLGLNDAPAARRCARAVLQMAGSRGLRLLSLEARAVLARVTEADESATHRAVGADLVRDFLATIPESGRAAFLGRPFVRFLQIDDEEPHFDDL